MATNNYKYKALSKDGSEITGIIEAFDEYEAVTKIKQNGRIVTSIKLIENSQGESKDIFASLKIKEKTLSVMCSQFSIIINSGISIVRAAELIAGQTEDKRLKKILTEVSADIAEGHTLAQSFENKGGEAFPVTFIETIRSGEESGSLDKAFEKLHKYYDRSSKIKAKVLSAMMYPIFLIIVAVIVIIIIMSVAVPMFTRMFSSMGNDLPLPTKVLIGTSNFFTKYGLFVLIFIAAAIIAFSFWKKTKNGKLKFSKFKLKIPILGKVNLMKAASQFANTMSTMLSSGLTIVNAVTITGKVLDNYYIGKQISSTAFGLESGKKLGDCLKDCEFLPELLVAMTAVGEETGSTSETLDIVGEYFDNEVEMSSQKALSLLEPIVICILAVIVVFILLAVYLPMFGMYGGI